MNARDNRRRKARARRRLTAWESQRSLADPFVPFQRPEPLWPQEDPLILTRFLEDQSTVDLERLQHKWMQELDLHGGEGYVYFQENPRWYDVTATSRVLTMRTIKALQALTDLLNTRRRGRFL